MPSMFNKRYDSAASNILINSKKLEPDTYNQYKQRDSEVQIIID